MGTPVTWEAKWQSPLADYLADYRSLIGDRRTAVTFGEVVQGIIGAGTLVCERIAAQSAVLAAAQDGGQRVSRLATGESTTRSQLDAAHLTAQLRQRGAVWRTVWEQQERLVCRVKHPERLVEYRGGNDAWHSGDLTKAKERLRLVGTAQTTMVVQRGGKGERRHKWSRPRFGPVQCA